MTAPATESYINKEARISGVIRDLRSSAPAECLVSRSSVSSAHPPALEGMKESLGTRGLGTGCGGVSTQCFFYGIQLVRQLSIWMTDTFNLK